MRSVAFELRNSPYIISTYWGSFPNYNDKLEFFANVSSEGVGPLRTLVTSTHPMWDTTDWEVRSVGYYIIVGGSPRGLLL